MCEQCNALREQLAKMHEQSDARDELIVAEARRQAWEECREACATCADHYGSGEESACGEFEKRYGVHDNLAAAIRAIPLE